SVAHGAVTCHGTCTNSPGSRVGASMTTGTDTAPAAGAVSATSPAVSSTGSSSMILNSTTPVPMPAPTGSRSSTVNASSGSTTVSPWSETVKVAWVEPGAKYAVPAPVT